MREDTVATKVYPFDELSEEAKETVLEKMADINVDYEWWDSTFEDAETIGLRITGFDLDRRRHATGEWTEDAEDCARLILENHGEGCETYGDATVFLAEYTGCKARFEAGAGCEANQERPYENDEVFDETDTCIDLCEEFQRTILEDYSIILQKESEYLQSEEAIIETIKANEYEFTVDGKLY